MAKAEKRNYHHGDLRTALLQEGLRLLEERQGDDIGLREVARAAGVSATAVYRHFPDKAALLRGLAAQGLEKLARVQKAAFERAGGNKAGFAATGRAYVRFALDNPALFRLIFSSSPEQQDDIGTGTGIPEAFRMLRENAAFLAPPGASCDDVHLAALGAWAQVHGLAVLMLDGQIPKDERLIDGLIAPTAIAAA
jgi:AcrR family transcriptional regulator